VGLRGDRVEPNDEVSQQSFSALSPRVIFRSDWSTHEEISIGYSRYFYANRNCTGQGDPLCVQTPNGATYPDGLGATPVSFGSQATSSPESRGAPQDPNNPNSFITPHENVFHISASIWW
jgi:hypothetical protein